MIVIDLPLSPSTVSEVGFVDALVTPFRTGPLTTSDIAQKEGILSAVQDGEPLLMSTKVNKVVAGAHRQTLQMNTN